MVYFISICISILFSCGIKKQDNEPKAIKVRNGIVLLNHQSFRNIIFLFLSALPLWLISALRYAIGTDYFYTYVPTFNDIAAGRDTARVTYYEIGFYWINRIVACFTNNSQWLIAITSLIFILAVFWCLYKQGSNIPISVLLFVLTNTFFVSLNNVRQSLASAIGLCAIVFLINDKKLMFVIFSVASGLIHRTGFLLLMLLVVDYINFSPYFYLIATVAFFGVSRVIAPRLVSFIGTIIPRFAQYLTLDFFSQYRERSIGFLYIFINLILLLMTMILEPRKANGRHVMTFRSYGEKDRETTILKVAQFFILVICAMDSIVPAAYRIVRIFSFPQFLLIPNVIEKRVRNKRTKLILYATVLLLFSIYFLQNYLRGIEGVVPYRSIFEK